MAGETEENVGAIVAAESSDTGGGMDESKEDKKSKDNNSKKKKKKKGFFSRVWNGLFGSRNEDFERRLERISKEEKSVITRMRKRAVRWGTMKRNIILFSVLLEIVAVGYAIMTARTAENWKVRASRVLPMFLLPTLSSLTYSALSSFINMCERKDQKTLEKLQSERQEKIDELKERTNYYITQQLIQRYDSDPAAKAAAAAVLASKFTEGSGLKFSLEDESNLNAGKSHDVELVQSNGLRNRRQGSQGRSTSPGGATVQQHPVEAPPHSGFEYGPQNQQVFVDHFQGQGATAYNSGWLSRIAALLVGEDPTQCYALICGNCHMHNGLASKEDFPYVTYICPHCQAVNGPRIQQERGTTTNSVNVGPTVPGDPSRTRGSIVSPSHEDKIVGTENPDTDAPVPVLAPVEEEKTELPAEGDN